MYTAVGRNCQKICLTRLQQLQDFLKTLEILWFCLSESIELLSSLFVEISSPCSFIHQIGCGDTLILTQKSFSSVGHSMEPLHVQGAIRGSSFITSRHETQDEGRWALNDFLRGMVHFPWHFGCHFKKKHILEMLQSCIRHQQSFLLTNWCMLLEKIIYTPQKSTWNLRRMISKRNLLSVFQLPSLFFLEVYPPGEKKNRPLQGPLKGRYGTGVCSLAGPWRGWQPDQVGTTPKNWIALGFFCVREPFKKCKCFF